MEHFLKVAPITFLFDISICDRDRILASIDAEIASRSLKNDI